jgi:hypothetical protein
VNGNRLKTLAGLETLGPNIEVLDLSGNKLTTQSLCAKGGITTLPGSPHGGLDDKSIAHVAKNLVNGLPENASGTEILNTLKKLTEIRLNMNPVEEDNVAMESIIKSLRSGCKNLQAVDGFAFVSDSNGGPRNYHQWKITGDDESAQGNSVQSSMTGKSRKSGVHFNADGSVADTEALSDDNSDDEEEDHFGMDDDEEGEVDEDGMTILPDGTKKKREPKLRAKISTKNIKTMEQIEEHEARMRAVFVSSKEILQSIFLLDDTVDGLFSSVNVKDLPVGNNQFKSILEVSKNKEIEKVHSPTKPELPSPNTGMRTAIERLREKQRRTAAATGGNYSSDEEEDHADVLKGDRDPNMPVVDADGAVSMQHNVTIYTTQTDVDLGDSSPVRGKTKGPRTMQQMLEGDDSDDDDGSVKTRSSVDHLPGFRPLEMDRPPETNKEKVTKLVNSIKRSIENEDKNMTSYERKERERKLLAGGTVGSTVRSRHEQDLPMGSGLTRYGSKIKNKNTKLKDHKITDSSSATSIMVSPIASPRRSPSHHPSSTSNEDTSTEPNEELEAIRNQIRDFQESVKDQGQVPSLELMRNHEKAIKAEREAKMLWSGDSGSPHSSPSTEALKAMDYKKVDITVHVDDSEIDRNALQAAIDRRLGFSLTDPKSPVPRNRGADASSSPTGSYPNDDDISPRPGAFDAFQISGRVGGGSTNGNSGLFSQTFDPRFVNHDGSSRPNSRPGTAGSTRPGTSGSMNGADIYATLEDEGDNFVNYDEYLAQDAAGFDVNAVDAQGGSESQLQAMNDEDSDEDDQPLLRTGGSGGRPLRSLSAASSSPNSASSSQYAPPKVPSVEDSMQRLMKQRMSMLTVGGNRNESPSQMHANIDAENAALAAVNAALGAAYTANTSVSTTGKGKGTGGNMAQSLNANKLKSSAPKFRVPGSKGLNAGSNSSSTNSLQSLDLEHAVLSSQASGYVSPRPM